MFRAMLSLMIGFFGLGLTAWLAQPSTVVAAQGPCMTFCCGPCHCYPYPGGYYHYCVLHQWSHSFCQNTGGSCVENLEKCFCNHHTARVRCDDSTCFMNCIQIDETCDLYMINCGESSHQGH